ncbi:response regulator transcription factor [bacterium]|nr:response regulator transcription factor [bacterium]
MVLKNYLEMNSLKISWAKDGQAGYDLFKTHQYHLCILDIMMPKLDGFSLADKLNALDGTTPFIFLTARSLKKDIIRGYKSGARDYLTKPFDPEILLHKIKALVSHTVQDKDDTSSENMFLDYKHEPQLRRLWRDREYDELSPKENLLLSELLRVPNTLVKRERLLEQIWKENTYFTARSMDVYINKLRKRFHKDLRIQITNIRGEGFIFEIKDQDQ